MGFRGNGKTWFRQLIIIDIKIRRKNKYVENEKIYMTVYESRLREIYFDTQTVLVIRKRLACF